MWGLASFIFVRVFPQPSCNKREQASHFLFCIYPSQIVKKEFAENPMKSRCLLKLLIMKITNVSGKDLYNCMFVCIGPSGDAKDGDCIGNLMMGDSYVGKEK